ncbi:MAG: hypothetical protein AB7P50_12505 [Alphaproteobacteria bacterium]
MAPDEHALPDAFGERAQHRAAQAQIVIAAAAGYASYSASSSAVLWLAFRCAASGASNAASRATGAWAKRAGTTRARDLGDFVLRAPAMQQQHRCLPDRIHLMPPVGA